MKFSKLVHSLVFILSLSISQQTFAVTPNVVSGALDVRFPFGSAELPKSLAVENNAQNSCLGDLKSTSVSRVDILALGDNASSGGNSIDHLQLAAKRANALRIRLLKLGIEERFIWTTARTTLSTPLINGENAVIFYTGDNCSYCLRSGKCDTPKISSSKATVGVSPSPSIQRDIKLNIQFSIGSDVVPKSAVVKNATFASCLKSLSSVKASISSSNDAGFAQEEAAEQAGLAIKRAISLYALISSNGVPDTAIDAAIFVQPRILPAGYVPKPDQQNASIDYSGKCEVESDCLACKEMLQ